MDSGGLAQAERLVVKAGSSLLFDVAAGQADRGWAGALAGDVARLRARGQQVLIVSSGAVALGRRPLGLQGRRRVELEEKQAAAAVGQSLLMHVWEEAFRPLGLTVAQVLLTRDDTESRRRWLNARATIEALLRLGAVPVINENDTVATEEIRFGDNDTLAGRLAQMVGADLLVLLSDVDGLYTADPRRDPAARHLAHVERVGPEQEAMAGGSDAAGVGTGGMRTKLAAARIAGCATLIAPGGRVGGTGPLAAIEHGGRCTRVAPGERRLGAYKRWIAGSAPAGVMVADDGAVSALLAGKSLLSAGVREVEGRFAKGDPVVVLDGERREVARGVAARGVADARSLIGVRSSPDPLGERRRPNVLVHRSHLVLAPPSGGRGRGGRG